MVRRPCCFNKLSIFLLFRMNCSTPAISWFVLKDSAKYEEFFFFFFDGK